MLAALVADESGDSAAIRALANRPAAELRQLPTLLLEAGLVSDWRRVMALSKSARPNEYHFGLVALAEGRTSEAMRLLNSVVEKGADAGRMSSFLRGSLTLAAVQRKAGNRSAAIATLEQASRVPRWRTTDGHSLGYAWIRMRAALLALYREAGRQAEADAVEKELRQLMAVADPEHPIRAQLSRRR